MACGLIHRDRVETHEVPSVALVIAQKVVAVCHLEMNVHVWVCVTRLVRLCGGVVVRPRGCAVVHVRDLLRVL